MEKLTLDESIAAAEDMVRLMLWFMWGWLKQHPEDNFCYVIRNRVNLYGYTVIGAADRDYYDPQWQQMEPVIHDLFLASTDAADFEEQAFAALREKIAERATCEFRKPPAPDQRRWFGSLRYDPPTNPHYPGRHFLHIGNQCRPLSIFDDPAYLPRSLLALLDDADATYHVGKLGTSTWLNAHPRWLALFPREWRDNLEAVDTDVRWSQNFWGQFVNARGAFNHKHGKMFRATGEFPFPPRYSWCEFAPLRQHLEKMLAQSESN